jgi:glycosidase
MPDLNLDSEKVRNEIRDVMNFWLTDCNVDGFRLDAVTSYYTGNIDANINFLSWINTEAKKIKPQAYIVGEAWVGSDYTIDRYYESGCDSFFLFTGAQAGGTIATAVKQGNGKAVGKLFVELQETYGDVILAPFLGNHDTMRPGSFMPGVENLKMAAGVMSMMNGGVFVYYGEEIGMISKGGNNSDPAKRIAMKWEAKNIYEGCCYLPPENTPVDETSYYYPSVSEQMADDDSILNYYKQAMELRNRFPSIARGTVTDHSEGQNSYVCVITKEYQGEKITIVFNMDTFEQKVTLDKDALGYSELVGALYASGGEFSFDESGALILPPQSIVVLK